MKEEFLFYVKLILLFFLCLISTGIFAPAFLEAFFIAVCIFLCVLMTAIVYYRQIQRKRWKKLRKREQELHQRQQQLQMKISDTMEELVTLKKDIQVHSKTGTAANRTDE